MCFEPLATRIATRAPCGHEICLQCLLRLEQRRCPCCRRDLASLLKDAPRATCVRLELVSSQDPPSPTPYPRTALPPSPHPLARAVTQAFRDVPRRPRSLTRLLDSVAGDAAHGHIRRPASLPPLDLHAEAESPA